MNKNGKRLPLLEELAECARIRHKEDAKQPNKERQTTPEELYLDEGQGWRLIASGELCENLEQDR